MGDIQIGQGLGAANSGGTISVRLPNGKVVQSRAGMPISGSDVVVLTDESGKSHAFANSPASGSVVTKSIYRGRRKNKPAIVEDDYNFKVLQSSSIEGFDGDIDLDLTGYTAIGITNTGSGYYGFLKTSDNSSLIALSDGVISTYSINKTFFYFNPFFWSATGGVNYLYFQTVNRIDPVITPNTNSSELNFSDRVVNFTHNGTINLNASDFIFTDTGRRRYPFSGIRANLNTMTTSQWNYRYVTSVLDGSGTCLFKIDSTPDLPGYTVYAPFTFTYNVELNEKRKWLIVTPNLMDEVEQDFISIYSVNSKREYIGAGRNHNVETETCELSRILSPYSPYYVATGDEYSYDYQQLSTYSYVENYESFLENLDTGGILERRTITANISEPYREKGKTITPWIQGEDCAMYLFKDSDKELELSSYQHSVTETIRTQVDVNDFVNNTTVTSKTNVTNIETMHKPEAWQMVIKTPTQTYRVSDYSGVTQDWGKRFVLFSSTTASVGSQTYAVGYSPWYDEHWLYGIHWLNKCGYSFVKRLQVDGILGQTSYKIVNASLIGMKVVVYDGQTSKMYRGVVTGENKVDSAMSFSPPRQPGYIEVVSVNVNCTGEIDAGYFGGRLYLSEFADVNTVICSEEDYTSLLAIMWWMMPESSSLYTITDDLGNETVELAIAEIPTDTAEKDEWRADIYRFNTATLKWERRPNGVSALSQLTAPSDFISYHPTPSN